MVETSVIVEYLQFALPGPVHLLPADPMAALGVRFMDRLFDLHVMNAMQLAVDGGRPFRHLFPLGAPDRD